MNLRVIILLLSILCMFSFSAALAIAQYGTFNPAKESFEQTWARSDRPVANGIVDRTWLWGSAANTSELTESYSEAPGGERAVQYWDKSRMELNDPEGNPDHPWHVTNGLIALEMMAGYIQTGDSTFEYHEPAEIPVAGDPDDQFGPTYKTMSSLLDRSARVTGWGISQTINRDGTIVDRDDLLVHDIRDAYFVPETGHNVASVFWEFMNSSGPIYLDDEFTQGELFPNPFYATGFPVTEAYWASVMVNGEEKDVLIQCFERRCLTYTHDNPDGWKVEASNSGRHYYRWRYEIIDDPAGDDDRPADDDHAPDDDQHDDPDDSNDDSMDDDQNDEPDDSNDDATDDDKGDVPTDDLAIAVLSSPESIIAHSEVEPSMRWHTERGSNDVSRDRVYALARRRTLHGEIERGLLRCFSQQCEVEVLSV